MNIPLYIAKRYVFSKSKTKAINTITKISTLGILVSSMALFVVLSVFSGLKTLNLSYTNEIDPDLILESTQGKSFLLDEKQSEALLKLKEIEAYSFVIEERVVFNYGEKQLVANIKGVDSVYHKVTNIDKNLIYGYWFLLNTNQVVIGHDIALTLSVSAYSDDNNFEVLAMKPGEGAFESVEDAYNKIPLLLSGIYSFQNSDVDGKYIYADHHLVQELLEWQPNQFSKIEFKIADGFSEKEVRKLLREIFPDTFQLKNRSELNGSLHKMLQTESIAIYLIFTMVIIVTLFSLAGALIMMILEKKEHLKTLNDLGVSLVDLKRIFLFQGMMLSVFGTIAGLFLGLIVVYTQKKFELIKISDQFPYPVEINSLNLALVFFTILILSFLASLLASTRISKNNLSV